MKERPILFSAQMVRAILAGTKTQTRRLIKPQPDTRPGMNCTRLIFKTRKGAPLLDEALEATEPIYRALCPYGQPGDRLWVRETFSGPYCMEAQDGLAAAPPSTWAHESRIWYWADGQPTHGDWTRPRPSIHMPRWASRITLEITDVKVERLQDISEADAMAEGIVNAGDGNGYQLADTSHYAGTASESYASLWESINGEGSWDANPHVWCVSFKRLEAA